MLVSRSSTLYTTPKPFLPSFDARNAHKHRPYIIDVYTAVKLREFRGKIVNFPPKQFRWNSERLSRRHNSRLEGIENEISFVRRSLNKQTVLQDQDKAIARDQSLSKLFEMILTASFYLKKNFQFWYYLFLDIWSYI